MLIRRKPSTQKQIASAQANGRKSRGPVSAEGKRRSSRNSVKHGFLADASLLEASAPDFVSLQEELRAHYQPQTAAEDQLIEVKALADWRLGRILACENTFTYLLLPSPSRRGIDNWLGVILRYGPGLEKQANDASFWWKPTGN